MGMITQEAYFRQRVLSYAAKHGVTAAAIRYHIPCWPATVRCSMVWMPLERFSF